MLTEARINRQLRLRQELSPSMMALLVCIALSEIMPGCDSNWKDSSSGHFIQACRQDSDIKVPAISSAAGHYFGRMTGSLGRPNIRSCGNVTVLSGHESEMKCYVNNLANNTVVWIRHRDTHLLSAGSVAYIVDERFSAYENSKNIWSLRISKTKPTDIGIYECQVPITPPVSAFTFLSVVEPITQIIGAKDNKNERFINSGSLINLTCVVQDATENAPKHVLWRHGLKTVNFEWARGGMSLVTEKMAKGTTISRLLIQNAVEADSGIYTCSPSNAHSATIQVHILSTGKSEKQAAMYSCSAMAAINNINVLWILLRYLHSLCLAN